MDDHSDDDLFDSSINSLSMPSLDGLNRSIVSNIPGQNFASFAAAVDQEKTAEPKRTVGPTSAPPTNLIQPGHHSNIESSTQNRLDEIRLNVQEQPVDLSIHPSGIVPTLQYVHLLFLLLNLLEILLLQ